MKNTNIALLNTVLELHVRMGICVQILVYHLQVMPNLTLNSTLAFKVLLTWKYSYFQAKNVCTTEIYARLLCFTGAM